MKRTRHINLEQMRKAFTPKAVAMGVASVFLTACDSTERAFVYFDDSDCSNENPSFELDCRVAYKEALEEAQETFPRFGDEADCEYEFGRNQCEEIGSSFGSNIFIPVMAGYMISNLGSGSFLQKPLFTSYNRRSPYYQQWVDEDGDILAEVADEVFDVHKKIYKNKPKAKKTLKRGGFGSIARAKSSFGSSRGGWGG